MRWTDRSYFLVSRCNFLVRSVCRDKLRYYLNYVDDRLGLYFTFIADVLSFVSSGVLSRSGRLYLNAYYGSVRSVSVYLR